MSAVIIAVTLIAVPVGVLFAAARWLSGGALFAACALVCLAELVLFSAAFNPLAGVVQAATTAVAAVVIARARSDA